MPRFFTRDIAGDIAYMGPEDARHLCKSLRMREGEEVTLCDGQGFDYRGVLLTLSPEEAQVRILEQFPSESEPVVEVVLYQALPKGDKLDFIVQKATELGVREIVPVLTTHCVSRPDPKSMEKKRVRLRKIAAEAAKQSGRGRIPSIAPLHTYGQALAGMKQAGLAILLYERATVPLRQRLERIPDSAALMVGSEGGFSPEEAALAEEAGVLTASLGKRILRCETAPVCALSALLFAAGEF